MNRCLRSVAGALALLAGIFTAATVASAPFPEPGRTIKLVVPWSPGGSVDVFARLLAPGLEKELGTKIDIVNRPGAGAQVGLTEVARSAPDGYTLGIASLPGVITIYLDPKRQAVFNRQSFALITLTGKDPEAIAVNADSPFGSIKDLAEAARNNPGGIRISVGGLMGDSHLGGILLEKAMGADVSLVSFDGGLTPALTAMLGGHTDAYVGAPSSIAAVAQSGDIRVLAIMAEERNPLLPDVPTLREQGFEGAVMGPSRGVIASAGTPAEVIAVLNAAIQKAMQSPQLQENLRIAWTTAAIGGPADFQAHWDQLEASTRELLKELGGR